MQIGLPDAHDTPSPTWPKLTALKWIMMSMFFVLFRIFSDGVRLARHRLRSGAVQSLPGLRDERRCAGPGAGEHRAARHHHAHLRALLQRTSGRALGRRAGHQVPALLSLSRGARPQRPPKAAVHLPVPGQTRLQRPQVRPFERIPVPQRHSNHLNIASTAFRGQCLIHVKIE